MGVDDPSSGSCSWNVNLASIRHDMISIAKQASEMIAAATAASLKSSSTTNGTAPVNTKKNTADLVTETDQAVERLISSRLCTKYPTFKFLGEETYVPGQKLGAEPTFVVDPIDGTTNFVHNHPYVSVSIGFAVNKEPLVGVVLDVARQRMYVGTKGEGSVVVDIASGTERSLPLRQTPEPLTGLDSCLVAIEWGSDREGNNWKVKNDTWRLLGASKSEGGAMVHSARALGSAALNLCGVAEGTLDVYWEGGCWAWDVCAGWVILKEAGGTIVDGNSGTWEIPVDHRKYLAVRGSAGGLEEQKQLVQEFWGFVQGDMEYES
jgi:myo-inositol-1(or 4)-monophosphatase